MLRGPAIDTHSAGLMANILMAELADERLLACLDALTPASATVRIMLRSRYPRAVSLLRKRIRHLAQLVPALQATDPHANRVHRVSARPVSCL